MFWVQNVGPSSIDLDKLTQEMTSYYSKQENQVAISVRPFSFLCFLRLLRVFFFYLKNITTKF